jgi:hypothetical protein
MNITWLIRHSSFRMGLLHSLLLYHDIHNLEEKST